jgi:prevent-host-death family protein
MLHLVYYCARGETVRQINVHEAKTHFSKLLEQVEQGEEIVVARAGKPVVRMIRYQPEKTIKRKPGRLKGKIIIHPSFFEDTEITAKFINGELFPKP